MGNGNSANPVRVKGLKCRRCGNEMESCVCKPICSKCDRYPCACEAGMVAPNTPCVVCGECNCVCEQEQLSVCINCGQRDCTGDGCVGGTVVCVDDETAYDILHKCPVCLTVVCICIDDEESEEGEEEEKEEEEEEKTTESQLKIEEIVEEQVEEKQLVQKQLENEALVAGTRAPIDAGVTYSDTSNPVMGELACSPRHVDLRCFDFGCFHRLYTETLAAVIGFDLTDAMRLEELSASLFYEQLLGNIRLMTVKEKHTFVADTVHQQLQELQPYEAVEFDVGAYKPTLFFFFCVLVQRLRAIGGAQTIQLTWASPTRAELRVIAWKNLLCAYLKMIPPVEGRHTLLVDRSCWLRDVDPTAIAEAWKYIARTRLVASSNNGLFLCDEIAPLYGVTSNTFTEKDVDSLKLNLDVPMDPTQPVKIEFVSEENA